MSTEAVGDVRPQLVLRHSLTYLVVRGGPAVISLAGLLLFTHLLVPAEFGQYALIIAGVGVANAGFFWWLQLGLLRFLPGAGAERPRLLSAVVSGYAGGVLATVPVALSLVVLAPGGLPRPLIVMGCILLWTQAWHELNLEMARSDLSPGRYGKLLISRAMILVAFGSLAARAGAGAMGVITAGILGALIPSLFMLRKNWSGVKFSRKETEFLYTLGRYGAPLVPTSALIILVTTADRFFLSWFGDNSVVGVYSAASDLTQLSLLALMNVVYVAYFPLAVRALETSGAEGARATIRQGGAALLAVGVPATVALAMLAPLIARNLLGPSFQGAAAAIPWIGLATFFACVKAFYFDVSFQLGRATGIQLRVAAVTAILSIALNYVLVPRWGFMGAAYATTASFASGALISALLGRAVFRLPFPVREAGSVALATAIMACAILALHGGSGMSALGMKIVTGAVTYAVALIALDFLGMRAGIRKRVRARYASVA